MVEEAIAAGSGLSACMVWHWNVTIRPERSPRSSLICRAFLRIRGTRRLARLLVPVCVAYLWLVGLGAWIIKRGWRRQIDRPDRRDLSLFQLGLEWLEHCLAQNLPLSARFQPILS